ncbi:MAG TPA: carboxypeptidase-like regulatory domain-containing protein [Bryobacteraceae bacterium]|nr:carboxypeptidase-like regulatory domain-containing protein [Bryobacteraceae bacterium]
MPLYARVILRGALIPNASVTARDVNTNLRFEAKTNPGGEYVVPILTVGAYEITVSATGLRLLCVLVWC